MVIHSTRTFREHRPLKLCVRFTGRSCVATPPHEVSYRVLRERTRPLFGHASELTAKQDSSSPPNVSGAVPARAETCTLHNERPVGSVSRRQAGKARAPE